FFHATVGQLVGALVAVMAGVPTHPFPGHLMAADLLVQLLPEVGILHRLLGSGLPAALLPVRQPLGDATHHVFGISYQAHLTWPLQLGQAADRRGQLHAVVGGLRLATPELLLHAFVDQQRAPASGAGIALAGTVGEDFDQFGHSRGSVLYSDSRRLILATGIGTNWPLSTRCGWRSGRRPTT